MKDEGRKQRWIAELEHTGAEDLGILVSAFILEDILCSSLHP